MKTVVLAAIASLLCIGTVRADCVYPKAPDPIPNGKTASKDEMVAAMNLFKQYNADLGSYTECLETETAEKIRDGSMPAASIMQFKQMQARKHNSAVQEVKEKAEAFNDQVRIFKSRST